MELMRQKEPKGSWQLLEKLHNKDEIDNWAIFQWRSMID